MHPAGEYVVDKSVETWQCFIMESSSARGPCLDLEWFSKVNIFAFGVQSYIYLVTKIRQAIAWWPAGDEFFQSVHGGEIFI